MNWERFSNPLGHAEVARQDPRARWWREGVRDARNHRAARADVPGPCQAEYTRGYEAESHRMQWAQARDVPGAFTWNPTSPTPDCVPCLGVWQLRLKWKNGGEITGGLYANLDDAHAAQRRIEKRPDVEWVALDMRPVE